MRGRAFTRGELERLVGGPVAIENGRAVRALAREAVGLAAAGRSPYRSKWEAMYAGWLDVMQRAGQIESARYEAIKLRVAVTTEALAGRKTSSWYTPDFLVVRDGIVGLDEVKGHWRPQARVKMKVIAEQFPQFPLRIVQIQQGKPITIEAYNLR